MACGGLSARLRLTCVLKKPRTPPISPVMSKVRHGRKNSRVLCASLIEVEFVNGPSRGCSLVGVVEDVCEDGLCISLEMELRPGTEVILHESDRDIHATVRHSTEDETGSFHIGVEFERNFEWAQHEPWPTHRAH